MTSHITLQRHDPTIHLVKEVTTRGGMVMAKVCCGQQIAPHVKGDPPVGYTGWDSRVTCPICKWHSIEGDASD